MIHRRKTNGSLYIVTAPSGAGKNTIIKRILTADKNLLYSISMTTRSPRAYEHHGESYFFAGKNEFHECIDNNEFLEWAEVHGNYYGTLKSEIHRITNAGFDAIMDLDVQGALHIKDLNSVEAVYIFIIPPNFEILKKRLKMRGTESEEEIKLRLRNAVNELQYLNKFDYVIINDEIDQATNDMQAIISSQRLRTQNFQLDNTPQNLLE